MFLTNNYLESLLKTHLFGVNQDVLNFEPLTPQRIVGTLFKVLQTQQILLNIVHKNIIKYCPFLL